MAVDVTSLPSWTGRTATRSLGENLVAIQVDFDGSKLVGAVAAGNHIGLCELPFGATVISAQALLTTGAGGVATGTVGVLGFTSYLDGAFTDNATTGNNVTGLIVTVNMNLTTPQPIVPTATMGAMIGAKLDQRIFTEAAMLGKPLYITYECADATTALTAVRGYFTFVVLCP